MAFLMIHYLTGGRGAGRFAAFLRRRLGTLPLLGLLFVPIFFGMHYLYPWAQPARIAADQPCKHSSLT